MTPDPGTDTPRMGRMTTPDIGRPADRPRGKSPQRRFRIPDRTYLPALKRATEEQRELGHVVTELLDAYTRGDITL